MKSIKHFLLAVLALATVLTVVSCKDEDDGPSTVALYSGENFGVMETVTFLDDGTWTTTWDMPKGALTVASGTYTGDPSKDGDVTIKTTKVMDDDGNLVDLPAEYIKAETLTVKNGKTTYDGVTLTRR